MRLSHISSRKMLIFGAFLTASVFGGIMANTDGGSVTLSGAELEAQDTDAQSGDVERALPDPLLVMLATSKGEIVLELDPKSAPFSVDNFLEYVKSDYYSGTIFHRVIEGFMIQGGGFTTAYDRKQTNPPVQNEANNGVKNTKYTIAMARTSSPHSATAQFFINAADNDYLDYRESTTRGWGHTVFGRVVDGHDVVDTISQVETGAGGPFSRDAPREQVTIDAVSIMYNDEEPVSDEASEQITTNTTDSEPDSTKSE